MAKMMNYVRKRGREQPGVYQKRSGHRFRGRRQLVHKITLGGINIQTSKQQKKKQKQFCQLQHVETSHSTDQKIKNKKPKYFCIPQLSLPKLVFLNLEFFNKLIPGRNKGVTATAGESTGNKTQNRNITENNTTNNINHF